jgi:AraC-like DNA-binding protein
MTANDDPVVGPALRLAHHTPQHPWTVAELAAACLASRAAFARRFPDLVGEPPIAYLTGWRLALAADLLREPDASVGSVAHRVGYGSPFTLSTAFRRHFGVSHPEHRAGERPPGRGPGARPLGLSSRVRHRDVVGLWLIAGTG